MSGQDPLDDDLLRAIQRSLEAEEAFGVEELPAGEPLDFKPSAPPVAQEPAGEIAEASSEAPAAVEAEPSLDALAAAIAACTECGLHAERNLPVPGQGAAGARLMFVGEAPGHEEDQSGLAFVGPSGQLLTKMITAMGLEREDVFIANVLKRRPPNNRDPRPDERGACLHFLLDQIDLVNPEVICCLGGQAIRGLTGQEVSVGRMRGKIHDFHGRQMIATYHPSYLLRQPSEKRKAWQDLQLVMSLLGLKGP